MLTKYRLSEIKEIKKFSYSGEVYDIEVEEDHSYCVSNNNTIVHNCSDAAHGLGAGIVLDGGMRSPGDVAKAFVANSDMVMIGGMFAGTDEQEGDIIERIFESDELEWEDGAYKKIIHNKKYKIFYGMSSEYAQEKHMSGMKDYRTSEGRVEQVEYKGPVQEVIGDLLGGLRSAGTYIGANSIKNFGKCGTLIRVNRQHDRF